MSENNLQGQVGELRMTIGIKRKETGKTETYELVGKVTGEEYEQLIKEETQNGSDPQHSGT